MKHVTHLLQIQDCEVDSSYLKFCLLSLLFYIYERLTPIQMLKHTCYLAAGHLFMITHIQNEILNITIKIFNMQFIEIMMI